MVEGGSDSFSERNDDRNPDCRSAHLLRSY